MTIWHNSRPGLLAAQDGGSAANRETKRHSRREGAAGTDAERVHDHAQSDEAFGDHTRGAASHGTRPEQSASDNTGDGPSLTVRPEPLVAQTPARLVLAFPAGTVLEQSHGHKAHMVIVSDHFDSFSHVHARDEDGHELIFDHIFAQGGNYLVAVDYVTGTQHRSSQFIISVQPQEQLLDVNNAQRADQYDEHRTRRIGKYTITLTSPDELRAHEEVMLSFHILFEDKDATDLQPYLHAPMHIAVIREDLGAFLHAHGELHTSGESEHEHGHAADHGHAHLPSRFGPDIVAPLRFPSSGKYHLYAEFKHAEQVIAAHFVLNVD